MASENVRHLIEALQGELARVKDDASRIERAIGVLRAPTEKATIVRASSAKKRSRKGEMKNISPEMRERALVFLASADRSTTVTDLAEAIGVHTSSASNALATLEREGKVVTIGNKPGEGGRGRAKLYALVQAASPGERNGDLLDALRTEEIESVTV